VVSVSVSGARGEKARLTLEDGLELSFDTETLLAEAFRPGDAVDAQLRARLVEASLRWQIREAALRLLAYRARSRGELATRLRRKDFPSRLIRPVLDDLEDRGWLDDAEFARSWIRDRLRLRPRGRRALLAELRKKGVEAAVAEAALEEIFADPDHSERKIALTLAESWLRRQPAALAEALMAGGRDPTADKARRRFQGHLARRGIPGGLIRQALDHLRDGGSS
jgi:regulatory protein